MTDIRISVLLCTRNPRTDHLRRTLDALRAQTLPADTWELFLLDNESEPPLSSVWRPAWHPRGVLERVEPAGKVNAILHGIGRARGELICTVDDDNVLAPDYLANAVASFAEHPQLGVAGGRIAGEFEAPPPPGARRYLPFLAVRDFGAHPRIAAAQGLLAWTPCGAGMVFRRAAGLVYARRLAERPCWKAGRVQDTQFALVVAQAGYHTGYLPTLRMTHLIHADRVQPAYLESLLRLSTFQSTSLLAECGLHRPVAAWRRMARHLFRGVYAPTAAGAFRRRMERARAEAERDAARREPAHGRDGLADALERDINQRDGRS